MYVIIGNIVNEQGEVEACKIFDTTTFNTGIYSMAKIKNAMRERHNLKVKGLKLVEKYTWDNKKIYLVCKEKERRFNFNKIPKLNGAGELINVEDAKKLTVIGWHDFAEMKKYHCIDYKGQEVIINITEFIKKVKENQINGAFYNVKRNRVNLCKDLNIEIGG